VKDRNAKQNEREYVQSLIGDLKFKKDEIDYESAVIVEFMQYANKHDAITA
jgi:hypothetical protein